MAAGFRYPLPLCFFSLFLPRKKAENLVLIGVERDWKEDGKKEDYCEHYIYF